MSVMLTAQERAMLEAAVATEQRVRRWKRYQAVLLRAEGRTVAAVAAAWRCSPASVYGWTARWRRAGVPGWREGDHGGGRAEAGQARKTVLAAWLRSGPQQRASQATGWT